jgi:hypothetical protein
VVDGQPLKLGDKVLQFLVLLGTRHTPDMTEPIPFIQDEVWARR